MYADDNRDLFPDCTGAVWPWDLPAKAANAFVKNGGTRNILYCPAVWKQNDNELRAVSTGQQDRKSKPLDSSHPVISYAGFCLEKKKKSPYLSFSRVYT